MSIVSYNGITLPYGMTSQFSQDEVYDNVGSHSSPTDPVYQRFEISVRTIVNMALFGILNPDLNQLVGAQVNAPAAAVMAAVRQTLMKPRKTLSFTFNGTELIPTQQQFQGSSRTVPGTVDARNGPQPQYCRISQLTNETFLVEFHIVAHYFINPPDLTIALDPDGAFLHPVNLATANVISHRWQETQDIDDCNFSVRTRNGVFTIRSDNTQGGTADQFRVSACITGVPLGFRRVKSSYNVSADGLTVEYSLVDQEVFIQPPRPAMRAEGDYMETAIQQGAQRIGASRIKLWGDKTTGRGFLAQLACGISATRLVIQGAQGTNVMLQRPTFGLGGIQTSPGVFAPLRFGILIKQSIQFSEYENMVEAICIAWLVLRDRTRQDGIPRPRFNLMDGTPQSPFANPPAALPRGTANLFLQAAAYYDPALRLRFNPATGQFDNGVQPGTAGVRLET